MNPVRIYFFLFLLKKCRVRVHAAGGREERRVQLRGGPAGARHGAPPARRLRRRDRPRPLGTERRAEAAGRHCCPGRGGPKAEPDGLITRLFTVGISCVRESSQVRPTMREVVHVLSSFATPVDDPACSTHPL